MSNISKKQREYRLYRSQFKATPIKTTRITDIEQQKLKDAIAALAPKSADEALQQAGNYSRANTAEMLSVLKLLATSARREQVRLNAAQRLLEYATETQGVATQQSNRDILIVSADVIEAELERRASLQAGSNNVELTAGVTDSQNRAVEAQLTSDSDDNEEFVDALIEQRHKGETR